MLRSYLENGFEEGASDYAETKDHLGSIRDVIASNGVSISSQFNYGPWGGSLPPSTPGNFAGTAKHDQSDLEFATFRAYGDYQGRWLSRDPLMEGAGVNVYAYAENRPTVLTDPTGLLPPDSVSNCVLRLGPEACGVGPTPPPSPAPAPAPSPSPDPGGMGSTILKWGGPICVALGICSAPKCEPDEPPCTLINMDPGLTPTGRPRTICTYSCPKSTPPFVQITHIGIIVCPPQP